MLISELVTTSEPLKFRDDKYTLLFGVPNTIRDFLSSIFKAFNTSINFFVLGALKSGRANRSNWIEKDRIIDVYDAKRDLVQTLVETGFSREIAGHRSAAKSSTYHFTLSYTVPVSCP